MTGVKSQEAIHNRVLQNNSPRLVVRPELKNVLFDALNSRGTLNTSLTPLIWFTSTIHELHHQKFSIESLEYMHTSVIRSWIHGHYFLPSIPYFSRRWWRSARSESYFAYDLIRPIVCYLHNSFIHVVAAAARILKSFALIQINYDDHLIYFDNCPKNTT